MSGKRAKLNRKEDEKPILTVTIEVFKNRVGVNGFPRKWADAKSVMDAAMDTITQHFILNAMNGNLDSNMTLPKRSDILLPDAKKIIVPGSVH